MVLNVSVLKATLVLTAVKVRYTPIRKFFFEHFTFVDQRKKNLPFLLDDTKMLANLLINSYIGPQNPLFKVYKHVSIFLIACFTAIRRASDREKIF